MKALNENTTRILVVESALVIAKSLQESLEDLGFRSVDTISAEEDCFGRAREFQAELAIVDVDGDLNRSLRIARALREEVGVPIIFLSKELDEPLVRTLEPIAHGLLRKPVAEKELWVTVDQAARRAKADRELSERNRQSEAIAQLTTYALKNPPLERLKERIVGVVAETLRVKFARLLELSVDGTQLLLKHGVGWRAGAVGTDVVNSGRGSLAGYAITASRPVIVVDLRHESRFFVPPLLRDHGVVSSVLTVVHGERGPFGVIAGESDVPRYFTEHDAHFLETAAALLSQALLRDQTRRMLEWVTRSHEQQEEFTRIASHDLREPLRGIHLYAQLVERQFRGKIDVEAERYLDYIISNARRMHELVQRLAEYSLHGSSAPEMIPVDTQQIVASAIRALKPLLERSGAEIDVGPLPTIQGDPEQLSIVFQNLISNAIKFHGTERPRISVRAEHREDIGHVIVVSDNGRGFCCTNADDIFQVFRRSPSTAEAEPGGVGLAICRKIVENHGGRIWAESKPGAGSRFFVQVPDDPPGGESSSV